MFRSPPVDLIVVLIIVLLILGPKRLPGIGKGLGQGMREFKEGITGESKHEEKPELSESRTVPEPQPSSTEPASAEPASAEPASRSGSGTSGSERSS
ncbi:MAG: twin-arginine translocase TatA/TatE family subunit [Solirubrobacteraceae bacterium]